MDGVPIILAAYHEHANWARHYDTVRIGLTSLLLTLAGGAASAVLALSNNRKGQVGICVALIFVGTILTGLSAVYFVDYHKASGGSGKLQELAVEYAQGEKTTFCHFKQRKKIIQGHFEAFDKQYPHSVAALGCDDDEPGKVVDKRTGEWKKTLEETPGFCAYMAKALTTGWFWLNLAAGVVIPASLILLVRRGVF